MYFEQYAASILARRNQKLGVFKGKLSGNTVTKVLDLTRCGFFSPSWRFSTNHVIARLELINTMHYDKKITKKMKN